MATTKNTKSTKNQGENVNTKNQGENMNTTQAETQAVQPTETQAVQPTETQAVQPTETQAAPPVLERVHSMGAARLFSIGGKEMVVQERERSFQLGAACKALSGSILALEKNSKEKALVMREFLAAGGVEGGNWKVVQAISALREIVGPSTLKNLTCPELVVFGGAVGRVLATVGSRKVALSVRQVANMVKEYLADGSLIGGQAARSFVKARSAVLALDAAPTLNSLAQEDKADRAAALETKRVNMNGVDEQAVEATRAQNQRAISWDKSNG